MAFGYWSINQFDSVFDNLSAPYVANILTASSFKKDAYLVSTSPEISGELATSTSSGQATTTPPELSFTFPQKDTGVYIGCTYPISWQSSTTIISLETALIDAGTRESVGPIASGLAKENTIEKDSQNLKWKVGTVWPGKYYIKISKVNNINAENQSGVFKVNKMPKRIGEEEKTDICQSSGGVAVF